MSEVEKTDAELRAEKWENSKRLMTPVAKRIYNNAIEQAGATLKSRATSMKAEYAKTVGSSEWNDSIDETFTREQAGSTYNTQADFDAETGYSPAVKERVQNVITLHEHLGSLVAGVVAQITGGSGNLEFKPEAASNGEKSQRVNTAIMANSANFSTDTNVANIVTYLKANHTSIAGISLVA